ncbi:hypothetical protein [Limnoglobus roseus]|uniref:Uncharacterized protein n=1 Tax=Limnoglobus roseus TaxID=2598579 RepID=A0A5C1AIR3_9BACT|nr:hypothetical protein [Limnoglobus roseus]QEL18750.1 hypothetical protein PX52LOC_05787 [Limnoglobus roseus]
MFVTFTQTRRVSEDGFTPKRCYTGVTYDLAGNAACHAISNGWAREATETEVANFNAANFSENEVMTSVFNSLFATVKRPFEVNPATPAVAAKLEA